MISRRHFLSQAAGAALLRGQSRRPLNLVLVLIDDLGWTDLGCYGSDFYETPNIDRLAAQGMRFTNAYAACPVCSPTRASVMTGKYPARLHLTDWIPGRVPPGVKMRIPEWRPYLPEEEVTIADVLKPAGYRCASIGKWHLGSGNSLPTRQGFELNRGGSEVGGTRRHFAPFDLETLKDAPPGEFLADRLTGEALRFLDEAKDSSFFLYLSHYDVHTPLQAKEAKVQKYRAKPKGARHKHPVYAAMIESVDESVGRVMTKLTELGLDRNTAVVFFSDNGGVTGRADITTNAPLRGEKAQLYEGGIRVPLIVRWPGEAKPGSECAEPVISNDLFPTLIEMAGLPPVRHVIDGISLAPALKGRTAELMKREALYWHYPHYNHHQAVAPTNPCGAIRVGDWKLIEFYQDNSAELYNLRQDPGERRDLAKTSPAKVAELRAKAGSWRQNIGAQMPTPDPANYDPEKTRRWVESGFGMKR